MEDQKFQGVRKGVKPLLFSVTIRINDYLHHANSKYYFC